MIFRTLPQRLFAFWTGFQFLVGTVSAQTFNGPGLAGGVDQASTINGPYRGSLREAVLDLLYKVLGFLALAAIIMIIAAGVAMIMSGGSDTGKDRAKKLILYTVIGLVIILFARSLVGFTLYGLFW